jgi:transposase InsO family protein
MVYHEVLEDKTMESTTAALERALQMPDIPPPHMITIDNGGEFTGASFQAVLRQNGIRDWRTEPYTPQQNGKIERWWKTLEQGIVKRTEVERFIVEYNNIWSHRGLEKQTGRKWTPRAFWDAETKWVEHDGEEMGINYYFPEWWRDPVKRANCTPP